jgi:hypothetical protein
MFSIPYDSNLRYLPLMYFLPEAIIIKCPTLRSLPRCLGEVARSEKMIDLIGGDAFLSEISDAAAALVFPHFGFGGWKEHYTGYCPLWQLSYALPLWAKLLEEETGWGLQRLFQIPSTESIPFFDPANINEIIGQVVKRGIMEANLQPILDVVREMPCEEDFEKWDTNVRKDFLRKWYHTRSKRVKIVSLEACMEDEEHGIHETEDVSSNFEEKVIAEDFVRRFEARLSQKDMEILELRVEGFTYEEIADRMGYKNHSGVIKRMRAIMKVFTKYEEQQ